MDTDWNWVKGRACVTSGKLFNLPEPQCPLLCSGVNNSPYCASLGLQIPSLISLTTPFHVSPMDSPAQSLLCQLGSANGSSGKGRSQVISPSLSPCPGSFSASSCLSCWASSCGSSFCQEPLGRWALETSLHSLCSSSLSGGKYWLVINFLP